MNDTTPPPEKPVARTCKKATRTLRWVEKDPCPGLAGYGGATMQVTQGDEVTLYVVTPQRQASGQLDGWNVYKLLEQPDEQGCPQAVLYRVGPHLERCSCPWSTHHPTGKRCRHRAALDAGLRHLGLLESIASGGSDERTNG